MTILDLLLLLLLLDPFFGERLVARFPLQNATASLDGSDRCLPGSFCNPDLVRLGGLAHGRIIGSQSLATTEKLNSPKLKTSPFENR